MGKVSPECKCIFPDRFMRSSARFLGMKESSLREVDLVKTPALNLLDDQTIGKHYYNIYGQGTFFLVNFL